MSKIDQLYRAKTLLTQALAAASNSMPNDKSVNEARQHIKKALGSLDEAAKGHFQKKKVNRTQFEGWWNNVNAGMANVATAPMSPQAQNRSLAQLNAMIAEEQQKLADLEKASEVAPNPAEDLLNG